jgi:hypothetical protein
MESVDHTAGTEGLSEDRGARSAVRDDSIHPSAWKVNSRKFELIGFCELRLMRVLRSLLVVRVPSSIKITSST